MNILPLSFDLPFHNSVNFLPNHFKFSTVVDEKGASGRKGITSLISLNWHISVIYCRIELKSDLVKSD